MQVLPARNYKNAILLNLAHIEYLIENKHPAITALRREPWLLDEESGEALLSQLARTAQQKQRAAETEALREQFLDLGAKTEYIKAWWEATGLKTARHQVHRDVRNTPMVNKMRLHQHLVDLAETLEEQDGKGMMMYFEDDPVPANPQNKGVWGEHRKQVVNSRNAVQQFGEARPFFQSFHPSTKKARRFLRNTYLNSGNAKHQAENLRFAARW